MYHQEPTLNIGIEEEYQLIDPDSRELLGFVTQSMSREKLLVRERDPAVAFTQQLGEATVVVGTPVAADINEAGDKLRRLRESVLEIAQANDVKMMASGTHPFSQWSQKSEPLPRYRAILADAQMIARRLLAFGMHVHIGVEDRDLAIDVMNVMRYILPHVLCLSGSSPFWSGRNSGLKSYRSVLLDALPRTGIPNRFNSYHEYQEYVDILVRTNSIPDPAYIWWDIRPHHRFPTLEIRICDVMPSVKDTLAVAALLQAVVAWLVDLRRRNISFRLYERSLINENKWRALRYGMDGKLIDFGKEDEVPVRMLLWELMQFIDPMLDRLKSRPHIEHIYTMIERGSNADQQLAVWKENNEDNQAVVDFLIAETEDLS
jgi:carboxylate-amine ligase